jgi:hypothetical protein
LKWNTDTGLKGNITTVSHQDIFWYHALYYSKRI